MGGHDKLRTEIKQLFLMPRATIFSELGVKLKPHKRFQLNLEMHLCLVGIVFGLLPSFWSFEVLTSHDFCER